ncbi:MAG: family 78 glycoside hydrolase catalytic domain [Lachnospiraceae bacterium]|nr:family 78 glycoside hydrolase catalytic domain [Lachnospiraceae bacterium]
MEWNAKWIKPTVDTGDVAPIFLKDFSLKGIVSKATFAITTLGVYEAELNGKRIGEFILAPGWTSYPKRLQYQEYDVTELLSTKNQLTVLVGKGWYRSYMPGSWITSAYQDQLRANPGGLLAQLTITYEDGSQEIITTDEGWKVSESQVRFSEIYDGEIVDATFETAYDQAVTVFDGPSHTLIPQQGEEIREQERVAAARTFTTPKGEMVIDFGQEVTGYVETVVTAKSGDIVDLSFAEVMDKDGNFYTENYRSAKAQYHYICRDGRQTYKPKLTFWGFRYIRINQFPGGADKASLDNFTAITVHSDMKRIGYLSCSNPLLNKLFSNIIWGQKDNFLDVPTDCPQRDERLGWTGDAQVFVRTACTNYDAEKFFTKWLADMAADQHEDGYVGHVIPDLLQKMPASAAWSDAATICPWEVYMAYGNPQILENQFTCMHKWVDYITSVTTTPYLWTGGKHYGDWLGLDAPSGSNKGSTRADFIASAFYAYSASLVIKAGKVLGKDISAYESLYEKIVAAFRNAYPVYTTQTECVLAAHFKLAEDWQAAADQLAEMVKECGVRLKTGFVGTPYLLHVLSTYGYANLAYSLLLREQYPSWLYPVTKGATTIWEHWDGIMEDGSFWSANMNSFNHYAYGSVADWVYSVAAGINPVEEAPGYAKVRIAPIPDARLDWLKGSLETRHGLVTSEWKKEDGFWRYEITTPVESVIVIDGKEHSVKAGTYYFYSTIK